jgi:hypothetical protein
MKMLRIQFNFKTAVLFLAFTLACFSSNAQKKAPMVGNDKDAHGCKGSAGYQWSVIKNDCIRIFESGIRLDAQAKNLDKTLSAFVVFKSDTEDDKVELFMPNSKTSIILKKVGKNDAGTWKNKQYTLTQWKGMYSLENSSKKLLYQGMIK